MTPLMAPAGDGSQAPSASQKLPAAGHAALVRALRPMAMAPLRNNPQMFRICTSPLEKVPISE